MPLSGCRVIDISDEKGMLCGLILAGLGADVVKVEQPGGDRERANAPFYSDIPHPEGSLYWIGYNAGKRGITLNIETREGQEIFHKLSKNAHFVIESQPPGYLDALGLGYQSLSRINPSLVMTSITPFGQRGPHKDYQVSDIVMMAMGGLMYQCGDPDRPPLRITAEQAYCLAGLQAVAGTMIAHFHRQSSGEGQHIDTSIQECVIWASYLVPISWYVENFIIKREGQMVSRLNIRTRQTYCCQNGYVSFRFMTAQLASRTRALIRWMEEEGMAGELTDLELESIDFSSLTQQQMDRWEALCEEFFLKHTKEELYAEAAKRGIMLYPVNTINEVYTDPQLTSREFWGNLSYPFAEKELPYVGAPFRSDEVLWNKLRHAPSIGEHNREIYIGELGFSPSELSILKERGIV